MPFFITFTPDARCLAGQNYSIFNDICPLAIAGGCDGDCWQFNGINALADWGSHAHFHVAVEAGVVRHIHVLVGGVGFPVL